MPTSVLTSVAIAFPSKVGLAALPILKNTKLYSLDLQRKVQEMGGAEMNWFGTTMHSDVMAKFYAEERREAALRSWRKDTLETLLVKLQFDPKCRDDALQVVDGFIAHALTVEEDSLRFMIHRVDTRRWEVVEDPGNNRVVLKATDALPEDLREVQREFNDKHFYDGAVQRLYLWARKAFDDNNLDEARYATYQDALAEAQKLLSALQEDKIQGFSSMAIGAIATTAAVCVRDPLCQLSSEEKKWCFGIILESVCMHADNANDLSAVDATDSHGTAACAFVLAKMFDFELLDEDAANLGFAIAAALTHANLHVCASAAKGVRTFLWSRDRNLAFRCLSGVAEYARFTLGMLRTRRRHHFNDGEADQSVEDWPSVISRFRTELLEGQFQLNVEEYSLESHAPQLIHLPMLMIPFGSQDKDHIRLLKKTVGFAYEDQYREHRPDRQEKIHYKVKKEIQDCLSEHVVHSRHTGFEPIRDLLLVGCSKAPSFIYLVKLSFDVAMEKNADFDAIWSLWEVLAPELHTIALKDVNDRYTGRQNDLNLLLRGMLYSDCPWQGHPSESANVRRGARYLLDFAKKSGSNSHVFEALSSLIYNFHEVFFDEGVFILAEKFSADFEIISRQVNTAFYLEMSIARYLQIENRGMLNRRVYNACLGLLTGIVETGSARAYYLRENLIRTRRISL